MSPMLSRTLLRARRRNKGHRSDLWVVAPLSACMLATLAAKEPLPDVEALSQAFGKQSTSGAGGDVLYRTIPMPEKGSLVLFKKTSLGGMIVS
jgi:hypothetical protein